ncbi:piggyBac transposable element-derived protein 4 [Trichonephila clavipes]|uniref:PiggyBac transposable element-derived protein 4 n=1 Tax=Trichonephila clavipes TaxID=2585209 RepID=A0A8X6VY57_TRICX|nr:piggyBac transposable element-derived protein 4 [Trichonephila clavipes]
MWVEEKTVCPATPRFDFTESPGILVNISDDTLIQYFEYFFDNSMLELIVEETNVYAEQCFHSQKSKMYSKQREWCATCKEEVIILLCIWIMQGIVKKPVEQWYWSKDEKLFTPFFRKLMSYRRYYYLKKYLHFPNNENYYPDTHPNQRLNKIWPIYSRINELSKNAVTLEQDVSIDESLLLHKGRLSWKQYLPLKRARFGIKMYMLCEAKSGYVWSSIIFTGRGTLFDEEFLKPEFSKFMQVVLTLMKPLLNTVYCVTLDNYSSILTDTLVKCKTDSYGTINLNRKEVPSYVKSKKLKKGETVAFRRGKALILKWKDEKDVSLISTIHNSEIAVRSSREEKLKLKIVVDYNDTIWVASIVLTKIWHLMLSQENMGKSGSKSQLQFRLDLVNEMVIKYHSESMGSKRGRPLLKTPLRLTERHFVKFIPPTENKEKPARKCFICCRKRNSDGKKIRTETRYYYEKWDVGHDVC